MRTILLALVLLPLLCVSTAKADGFFALDSVHLDARGHFLFDGDGRSALGYPVGIDGELQLDLVGNMHVTAATGFLYGLGGDVTNWYIPFTAGLLYNIKQGKKTPFVGAAFGAFIGHVPDNTEVKGGFEAYGGYHMGSVRVKAGLSFFDTGHLGDSGSLFVSLGFNLR